jgi:hypothetical protein
LTLSVPILSHGAISLSTGFAPSSIASLIMSHRFTG